ncbi:putative fibroblast growth factor 1 [Oncorhynchus mykiss]|uniref:Fibroblast growth factor n=2 Tax=Oncorhynchus mykiss TaxID=8022 RepID=A0A8C7SL92_ONCMY|nr:putative fibroblast growth factor 1 [Oncorhynchus mykiss]WKV23885.1 fibroblast growth factor 1 [Oncorhynchus mykiss]
MDLVTLGCPWMIDGVQIQTESPRQPLHHMGQFSQETYFHRRPDTQTLRDSSNSHSGRSDRADMLAHLGHCNVVLSQPQGHLAGTSRPEGLYRMTEGEITVLSMGPTTQQNYRHLIRLYCMNGGHHLQILPDGTVAGSRDENKDDILKVKAVSAGVVAIKGHETGRYLAMDKDGHLYGSKTLKDECYFLEKMEENHYNTYRSQKYQAKDWFLGLKRNGQPKAGPRTHIGQKAIYFLPRPVDNTTM